MATIHTPQCHIANHINDNIDILKAKLQETLEHADGQIWIIPEAVFSTESHQISVDIILGGYLKGYGIDKKNYLFMTVVEVKHHCVGDIHVADNKIFVKYLGKALDVTEQSNKQKYIVSDALNLASYVTNVIWLDNINEVDIKVFAETASDIIGADFNAEVLLNKIIRETTHSEEEISGMVEMLCKEQLSIF